MITLQRTPLFDVYAKYGGKTIDFGGWELPVQFSSIKDCLLYTSDAADERG